MDGNVPVDRQPEDWSDFVRLLNELRQWQIFRIAAGYAVVSWLVVQVVATIGPAFDLPAWALRAVVLSAIVGFLALTAFMLFRPRLVGRGRMPTYLSRSARLLAGAVALLIAAVTGALSIRSLSVPEQVSLAVLPFADLSPTRDKAYFAEGVAEEILSSLAAEKGIKVLGRSSARQIERNPDPRAIRASLGVTHLLEGSARTAGDSLRVNVRLIDTSDGSQLWEDEYDGKLSDVFAVQDKIAGSVVRKLRGTFFTVGMRTPEPTRVDVYETYLAARALMRTRSEATLTKALELARKVIEVDPNYAPGHALFAELIFMLSDEGTSYGSIPVDKARAIAIPHARKAVALAPDKPEGHAALGLILLPEQSIEPLRRAIALDPGRTELRNWLGLSLTRLMRHDEAFAQFVATAEMEPLWPVAINQLVQALVANRMIDQARAVVRKFRDRGGSEAQALRFEAHIARGVNDFSGAIAADAAAIAKDSTLPYYGREWMAREFALLGLHERAVEAWDVKAPYARMAFAGQWEALAERAAADGGRAWVDPYVDAAIHGLGRARDWHALARLYARRPARFAQYCVADPSTAPIMILALRRTGNLAEADRVEKCLSDRLSRESAMTRSGVYSWPGRLQYQTASLLGVRADPRGLDWLERAVQRGWVGQYYSSSLSDWPQFDSMRGDARYAALQKRIDAKIARERNETLALN